MAAVGWGLHVATLGVVFVTHRRSALREAHDAEVRAICPDAEAIGAEWGLWRVVPGPREAALRSASSTRLVVDELASAPSLDALVPRVRDLHLSAEGWTMSVERLSRPADGASQATTLCCLAQGLRGAAATAPQPESPRLIALQSATAGYIFGRVVQEGSPADAICDAWKRRPFTFEAATDPAVARVALALAGVVGNGGDDDVIVVDPCAGSGTVLLAAAALGLEAVGSDANGAFVDGARANLRWAADRAAAAAESAMLADVRVFGPCDARGALPGALLDRVAHKKKHVVVSNLPWGRGLALSARSPGGRAAYVEAILRSVSAQLPGVLCVVSGEPLSCAGLHRVRAVAIPRGRGACFVTVLAP